jgi:hypothetical protein
MSPRPSGLSGIAPGLCAAPSMPGGGGALAGGHPGADGIGAPGGGLGYGGSGAGGASG